MDRTSQDKLIHPRESESLAERVQIYILGFRSTREELISPSCHTFPPKCHLDSTPFCIVLDPTGILRLDFEGISISPAPDPFVQPFRPTPYQSIDPSRLLRGQRNRVVHQPGSRPPPPSYQQSTGAEQAYAAYSVIKREGQQHHLRIRITVALHDPVHGEAL